MTNDAAPSARIRYRGPDRPVQQLSVTARPSYVMRRHLTNGLPRGPMLEALRAELPAPSEHCQLMLQCKRTPKPMLGGHDDLPGQFQ
jgi:hypothetical protein